ncbi:hypothetical protein FRX31_024283 [Thalictrum thalictroides]|uniref:Uncharacterized protein n=1 Tax=Thalictrum thalictroides TaxID=46969 RepID=A0A7J6VLX7_THATH|nr:hypothetical protein FRX31_024283 [Thalictrum thalictroides]
MKKVAMVLENEIPVRKPPYPFQFGQSSSFSMLPSVLEVLPEADERVTGLPVPAPVKKEEKRKQPAKNDYGGTTTKFISEYGTMTPKFITFDSEPAENNYGTTKKFNSDGTITPKFLYRHTPSPTHED